MNMWYCLISLLGQTIAFRGMKSIKDQNLNISQVSFNWSQKGLDLGMMILRRSLAAYRQKQLCSLMLCNNFYIACQMAAKHLAYKVKLYVSLAVELYLAVGLLLSLLQDVDNINRTFRAANLLAVGSHVTRVNGASLSSYYNY